MTSTAIAFLGPEGTFAHLATQRRFGKSKTLVAIPSIKNIFQFVSENRNHLGVVPIENSSGGTILSTVEQLTSGFHPLFIQESLAVNVKLALLGQDRNTIRVIYSHFAPLHHCENWLAANFPNAELHSEASTAIAVQKAALRKDAAAIGNRDAAKRYNLKVLEFPIEKESRNVTQFFVMGHDHNDYKNVNDMRTTIIAALPNRPGSLVDFLEPFRKAKVNLSRLISQPVMGQPETYVFLVDIVGSEKEQRIKTALKKAESVSTYIKNIGSYPLRPAYSS